MSDRERPLADPVAALRSLATEELGVLLARLDEDCLDDLPSEQHQAAADLFGWVVEAATERFARGVPDGHITDETPCIDCSAAPSPSRIAELYPAPCSCFEVRSALTAAREEVPADG